MSGYICGANSKIFVYKMSASKNYQEGCGQSCGSLSVTSDCWLSDSPAPAGGVPGAMNVDGDVMPQQNRLHGQPGQDAHDGDDMPSNNLHSPVAPAVKQRPCPSPASLAFYPEYEKWGHLQAILINPYPTLEEKQMPYDRKTARQRKSIGSLQNMRNGGIYRRYWLILIQLLRKSKCLMTEKQLGNVRA